VEVAYSFSNEPAMSKRAWLFGETICPVGMHTKDKSKAAAATLTKPLKKVEDILREKNQETLDANESVFTNEDDSYFDVGKCAITVPHELAHEDAKDITHRGLLVISVTKVYFLTAIINCRSKSMLLSSQQFNCTLITLSWWHFLYLTGKY